MKTAGFVPFCLFAGKALLLFVKRQQGKVFPEIVENSVENVDKPRLVVGFSREIALKTIFWECFLLKKGYK